MYARNEKYIKQGHIGNQFYLIKDLGNNVLVQNRDVGGAVGNGSHGQSIHDGELLGRQAVDLEPGC